ncbi:MAG: DUF418 domain-containing protein [Ferruginibacter sp.]|nr:DUF418 domain-containing protein [Ferruginibacter sp.]
MHEKILVFPGSCWENGFCKLYHACAGRQSCVLTWRPGVYWQDGPLYYTLFALAVFTFQVFFSTFWLRYFNYSML